GWRQALACVLAWLAPESSNESQTPPPAHFREQEQVLQAALYGQLNDAAPTARVARQDGDRTRRRLISVSDHRFTGDAFPLVAIPTCCFARPRNGSVLPPAPWPRRRPGIRR